jgi:thiol-disulfide isomerase/thioredoxin
MKIRSIGFIAVALLTATATTAVCFGEVFGLGGGWSSTSHADVISPQPFGATRSPLKLLDDAQPWLTPVSQGPQSLRGKVVVVNFWTYSCINSLRALPYLRAWSDRYASKGLVVVGVHAPEFEFEKDPSKVRTALKQLGVDYPNLQDNDYSVWQALGNEGWPGFYFVDAKGRVRGYRVGEGQYAEAEQLIRQLLTEAGHDPSDVAPAPVDPVGIEQQADWTHLASPEAYIGYGKATGFASAGGIRRNAANAYAPAPALSLNHWDLSGAWTVGPEFATLGGDAGAIRFRFRARDAHLVLGAAPDGLPVRFRVTIDGQVPGLDHGVDVDAEGWGAVTTDRLYQLVRQSGAVANRTVTIEFSRPGVRAYVFTFG